MRNFLSSVFLLFIFAHSVIAQSGAGMLSAGDKLTEGQRLYSPNKSHYLSMQADGNLCIYTSSDKFMWCSMATKGSGSYLIMQADGNLVVNDRENQAAWSTETQEHVDPKYGTSEWKPVRAMLDDNGLLGLYTAANKLIWNNAMGKLDTPIAVDIPSATEPIPVEGYTGPTVQKQLNIVLPMSSEAQNVVVEIADDGKVIYQSDMVLGDVGDFTNNNAPSNDAPPNDPSLNDDQSRKWPNSTIPYVLPPGHPKKDLILAGIKEVHDKTNLCVVVRTNQTDYVEFVSKRGNWATLGRVGGRQEISIDRASMGTVAHEILHAAGFVHAQSREDRDRYVTINFGNIQEGKDHNFTKQGKESNIGTYDFSSIMHYPAKAFSKNGRNTIDLKNARGNENSVMGQRDGLSAGDIAAVGTHYVPGLCKPDGAGLVASNTGNLPTTSTQTPAPTTATTTPNPARTGPTATAGPETATLKYQPRMKPGDRLLEGEKMVSRNGQYQLRGTRDGNFVIEEVRTGKRVYTFPLAGPINNPPSVSFLSYNPDGNVCIVSKQNKGYCATNGRDATAATILSKSQYLELTDNGFLVLVDQDGREIWGADKSNPVRTRPTTTATTNPARTRPTTTATTNPARTRPVATTTANPVRTRPTGPEPKPIADGKKSVPIPAHTPSATKLDNLALLPTVKTWQSYGDNTEFSNSQKAVDGNKSSTYSTGPDNSVSQTPPNLTPAWQIDLGQAAEVDHIVIWNSSEAPNLAGRSFYVTTGAVEIHSRPYTEPLAPDTPTFTTDVYGRDRSNHRLEPFGPYKWETNKTSFVVPINRTARKIRISLQKEGLEVTPLSIAEVEVFGKPYTGRSR